jgi:hypothetical protein
MNDFIPLAFFVGCLLATFGWVRTCEWLRPPEPFAKSLASGTRATPAAGCTEAAR